MLLHRWGSSTKIQKIMLLPSFLRPAHIFSNAPKCLFVDTCWGLHLNFANLQRQICDKPVQTEIAKFVSKFALSAMPKQLLHV